MQTIWRFQIKKINHLHDYFSFSEAITEKEAVQELKEG